MPLYMLTGKSKGRLKKSAWNPRSKAPDKTVPQPFYPVEPPQEFDEPGKELGPDAQVWKTYVREADQVDGELVDGWNKSTDVILIFAALFSAISTAFVIESYKSLVPDPADASAQTLLVISQTLKAMANGSQVLGTQSAPENELELPLFSATWSAICVNVLWFLSLSLSVAVSLISMLAKEWCLTFMSGRTGPPGAQARRRQQRWDGLLGWRMKEVLMVLPSLIHLSLLLFAIGLCVFLWGVHIGVAVPVIFVTTVAADAYIACTVLPFLDTYCPYGTVISMMVKRFKEIHTKPSYNLDDSEQDRVTANALHWMVTNCETPRSVDVALQSLAGAAKSLPRSKLAEWDMWTLIKRRLGPLDMDAWHTDTDLRHGTFIRALRALSVFRDPSDGLAYGSNAESHGLEALTLGLQSCIDGMCNRIEEDSPSNVQVKRILKKCGNIGPLLLKTTKATSVQPDGEGKREFQRFWERVENTEELSQEITKCLEQHLNGEVDLGSTHYTTLCSSLAFLYCCGTGESSSSVASKAPIRLLQAYVSHTSQLGHEWLLAATASRGAHRAQLLWNKQISRNRELLFLLAIVSVSQPSLQCKERTSPEVTYGHLEKAIELIWSFLVAATYSDPLPSDIFSRAESGALHMLRQSSDYNLDPDSCILLVSFLDEKVLSPEISTRGERLSDSAKVVFKEYVYGQLLSQTHANPARFPPYFLAALVRYLPVGSEDDHLLVRLDLYMFTVRSLCNAKTIQEKDTCYQLMSRLPFPKLSSRFVESLAANDLITDLSTALNNGDMMVQAFATAQLWLFFTMSLQFSDRTSEILTSLEKELLKYPLLDGDFGKQEMVVEYLETRYISLLRSEHLYFARNYNYLHRVLECMFQKRGEPVPKNIDGVWWLEQTPANLRGLDSSVYFEGEAEV